MAFENLQPVETELLQLRNNGLTLFQMVDELKVEHNISTSTGTLSRYFKSIDAKEELFGDSQPEQKQIDQTPEPQKTLPPDREWVKEFQDRDEKTRAGIAQLASEVRLLNETIQDSPLKPAMPGKQKRRVFFMGVGVGALLIVSALMIGALSYRIWLKA